MILEEKVIIGRNDVDLLAEEVEEKIFNEEEEATEDFGTPWHKKTDNYYYE